MNSFAAMTTETTSKNFNFRLLSDAAFGGLEKKKNLQAGSFYFLIMQKTASEKIQTPGKIFIY